MTTPAEPSLLDGNYRRASVKELLQVVVEQSGRDLQSVLAENLRAEDGDRCESSVP